jgi:hypothetical protein
MMNLPIYTTEKIASIREDMFHVVSKHRADDRLSVMHGARCIINRRRQVTIFIYRRTTTRCITYMATQASGGFGRYPIRAPRRRYVADAHSYIVAEISWESGDVSTVEECRSYRDAKGVLTRLL